jgi:hypothetical protein
MARRVTFFRFDFDPRVATSLKQSEEKGQRKTSCGRRTAEEAASNALWSSKDSAGGLTKLSPRHTDDSSGLQRGYLLAGEQEIETGGPGRAGDSLSWL